MRHSGRRTTRPSGLTEEHLLTLEPGISTTQVAGMRRSRLQLVIPSSLNSSHLPEQSGQLLDVRSLLDLVLSRQS
ncbi:MAG: hypothetical protein DI537_34110 [Stutzerimonas stutzeri]|nr:MAG: hypothetical protein DI537_34110 [Stutzerimonas stutzeri]